MKLIRFKEKYLLKFDECYGFQSNLANIEVNVKERIQFGFKRTTLRTHSLQLGNYRMVQGSYFKPKIETKFFLHIFMIEQISIEDLKEFQIKEDLGLDGEEFSYIRGNCYLNQWFFDEYQRINKKVKIEMADLQCLCHFKVKWCNNKQLQEFC